MFFNAIDERNWQRWKLNEENINNCLIYKILLTLIFSKGKYMKKIIKLSMITLAFSMIAACAATTGVGNIQSQIDDLNSKISQITSDAASAQAAAADAAASAEAAEAAANRAAQYAQDTNRKLDSGFRRSMVK